MNSIKKRNQQDFGMKARIGAAANSGLVHRVRVTAADQSDVAPHVQPFTLHDIVRKSGTNGFAVLWLISCFLLVAPFVQAAPIGILCGSIASGQTCGETQVTYTGPSDPAGAIAPHISPDFVGGPGTSSSAGGSGNLAGSASATADFGLLRATAVASNFYNLGTEPLPRVAARSIAKFADGGTVSSVGLPTGSPVLARITLDVDGSFSGDGESPIRFILFSNLQRLLVNYSITLLVGRPSIFETFDFDVTVGEMLDFGLELRASANAGNSESTMISGSAADVGQTAHLNLDFITDDVSFASVSGHDYTLTQAPVPEPAFIALMVVGLVGLTFARRARSGGRSPAMRMRA